MLSASTSTRTRRGKSASCVTASARSPRGVWKVQPQSPGESAAAYDEAGQAGEARRRTRLSHGVSPRMSPGMSPSASWANRSGVPLTSRRFDRDGPSDRPTDRSMDRAADHGHRRRLIRPTIVHTGDREPFDMARIGAIGPFLGGVDLDHPSAAADKRAIDLWCVEGWPIHMGGSTRRSRRASSPAPRSSIASGGRWSSRSSVSATPTWSCTAPRSPSISKRVWRSGA